MTMTNKQMEAIFDRNATETEKNERTIRWLREHLELIVKHGEAYSATVARLALDGKPPPVPLT